MSQVVNTLQPIISKIPEVASFLTSSPVKAIALPIIGTLGFITGAISGYEIGRTAVLKGRGMWTSSLKRPLILLITTIALSCLVSPPIAIAIAATALAAFLIAAGIAATEKKDNDPSHNFPKSDKTLEQWIQESKVENSETTPLELIIILTTIARTKDENYKEGTFVIEGEDAAYIYNYLKKIEGVYERKSSHFSKRRVEGHSHHGFDFPLDSLLPGNKRTILFGLATTQLEGQSILFIKPENWGADHRFEVLRNSSEKRKHLANHSLQFIHSQYVKLIRPGYDDRPGTAKERIPHKWGNCSTFGWAGLSLEQKQKLIESGKAKPEWLNDTYRTGQEVYIKTIAQVEHHG